jgi:CheY-like chemotaxis protein
MQVVTAEAISLLRVSLPAEVDFSVHQPPKPIFVSGVPAQLQQVLLNLCNNAAEAMGNDGCVDLEIREVELPTQLPNRGPSTPGRYVLVSVGDSGRGIDDVSLERIFEPFFTTRINGNGLGLATSLDIVREHGGTMNVQSVVGVGSRFDVWLPRIEADAPTSDRDIGAPPLGNGETVLVVETSVDRLLRDEEILAALGYEPVGFTRVADALAACRTSPGRFDVILVGHLVPATAALELTEELRHLAPDLAILLAAGPADEFDANALLVAGVSDIVPWPITAAEIAPALQDCTQRRGSPGERGFQKFGATYAG